MKAYALFPWNDVSAIIGNPIPRTRRAFQPQGYIEGLWNYGWAQRERDRYLRDADYWRREGRRAAWEHYNSYGQWPELVAQMVEAVMKGRFYRQDHWQAKAFREGAEALLQAVHNHY